MLFLAQCVCLNLSYFTDLTTCSYHEHMHTRCVWYITDMCVFMRVCLSARYNLKTVADICFMLCSYVGWKNEFACQGHRSRSFFGGFKVNRI